MAARNYRRQLLMLYQHDAGFALDANKEPSGFLKLEIKGSTGRLTTLVQNLRDIKEEGLVYKGFIAATDQQPIFLNTGTIPVDNRGKGESSWRFDPTNVDNTGYSIDRFNVFGIMVYRLEGGEQNFTCPLAGHTGKLHKGWKEMFSSKASNKTVGSHGLIFSEQAEAVTEEAPTPVLEAVAEEGPQAAYPEVPEATAPEPLQEPITFQQIPHQQVYQEQQKQEQQKQEPKPGYRGDCGLESYMEEVLRFYPRVQPFEYPVEGCCWRRINSYNYLFGIIHGEDGIIKYYAYGIPGMYNTQVHKQMEAYGFSQWRPQRGCGYTLGEYGYWLAFVDAETGILADIK